MYMKSAVDVFSFILHTQSTVGLLFVTPLYKMAFDDVFVPRDILASITDSDVKGDVL